MRTILVSAYACEPLKGSEQGVGWNWVLQMAKKNYLHVITRANNQELIEAHVPQDLLENITFHYYDTNHFIKRFKNKAKGLYFYYFFWQLGILPLVSSIIKANKIDYSMHLSMGSIWMPTFLPVFKTSFIWGPVGGGEGEPNSFRKVLPIKQRLLQNLRLLMNKLAFLSPLFLITSLKAKAILVRTRNTEKVIPKVFKKKTKIILETAMESDVFQYHREKNQNITDKEFHLISTGRLTPSKNILTAIKALSLIPSEYKIRYTIIGSGSEKLKIENEILKTKQEQKIEIISEVSRKEILEKLTKCDAYLFPSLREGGSWALMEAMAIGLPVICLKWTGMEIITDYKSAIQLPVSNPEQMPKDMADAIIKLITTPNLINEMGEAGRERIKSEFNWDSKGVFMEELFIELDNM
ncbi:glycosyltransferase family 4 protein [Winogradskyella helgolandensis]|uniref:glycosyltransferase family 4 protein n=1 Tax=Winogradskyella helgolandensis TaxID=2697010 RepID=UPI0015CEBB22|nr:glycosyltransferase [Winogradskyella helgolandensis]